MMYDLLYERTLPEQQKAYEKVGQQYREKELYRVDRAFMPMFAELSPRFARRFPYISNTFDNLHMLHDMVNDILASEWMTPRQQEEQITRAIWLVMAANHEGMEPGKNYEGDGLHDHRFMEGIPGMGLMPEGIGHNHSNPGNSGTEPASGHEGHNHSNPGNSGTEPASGHEGHNHSNPGNSGTEPASGHEGHNHSNPGNSPRQNTGSQEKQ